MTRTFRIEPEAAAELEAAAVWYDHQRPGLGIEFLEAVDADAEAMIVAGEFHRLLGGHLDAVQLIEAVGHFRD